MKSTLITIVTIAALLFSCSAVKTTMTDRSIINMYLEKTVYSKNYDMIFVSEEPLSGQDVIAVYETAYRDRFNNTAYIKVHVFPKMQSWPLDDEEVKMLKNKAQRATPLVWKANDFNDSRIVIKEQKKLNSTDFVVKYVSGNNAVLRLSKPIYSSDKQYVLFECGVSPILGGGYFSGSGIVLMKKMGGKWKQVTIFERDPYYY